MRTFWLNPAIFGWIPSFDTGTKPEGARIRRPHELFAHSERLLVAQPSDTFVRADALLNLRRVINTRLQHLEELYGFAEAFPRSVGALERLEAVGLARPLLIRQLFDVRNDIEHKDTLPPGAERCLELLDYTWYFLRSTDAACTTVPQGVVLQPAPQQETGSHQSLTVRATAPGAAKLDVDGWLCLTEFAFCQRDGFLEATAENSELRELTLSIMRSEGRSGHFLEEGVVGGTTRLIGGALLRPPLAVRCQFWKAAFATL